MLFNSYEYFVFFPVVVSLYFALPGRYRSVLLLAASYFFYMWWKVEYAALLVISTLVDYFAALQMARVSSRGGRRACLAASLLVNLGLLFTFKYYGLFRHTAAALAHLAGGSLDLPLLDVLLPVGISFYTFQTLSYSIEVYRGTIQPERSLIQFALYVSFFPQLVAGPIERPGNLLPQLRKTQHFDAVRTANGLKMIAWGLFKKVVIADRLALLVDNVYNAPGEYGGFQHIVATVFFAYQIYCDFSGYSDIAIGSAMVLGIDLMTNFDRPYAAKSIAEFWRRWHISLSTWFKDYVYIPLGGNRVPISRLYLNLVIVFAVSGLWHGASWTFVIWGLAHGLYMVVGIATRTLRDSLSEWVGLTRVPRVRKALQCATTFVLVCLAWVFFRAASLHDAIIVLRGMLTDWKWVGELGSILSQTHVAGMPQREFFASCGLIVALEVVSYFERAHQMREIMATRPLLLRWAFYVTLVLVTINFGVAREIPFIYFQF